MNAFLHWSRSSVVSSALQVSHTQPPPRAVMAPGFPISIFLQEACLRHQFIRSKDTSNVVERPERLRAVNVGLAAAIARSEEIVAVNPTSGASKPKYSATEELAAAMERLEIDNKVQYPSLQLPLVVKSRATLDVLNNAAVKFVHGDIEGDVYLENLCRWSKESRDKISSEGTEIPAGMSQGDLYLCPTSMDAIQGALATVCEAVDTVVANSEQLAETPSDAQPQPSRRAFVAVRPPGHHCGEDTPSGFCFVNNVVVGAAHAHSNHGITRVVIFDIDLHHGNGTQSLVWQINEETYRQQLEESYGAPPGKPGLQVFYGSLHDILSYPCEDGKPELVQAASVSIHGPHGQYVENIHLLPYSSEDHFWNELYEKRYSRLFDRATTFIQETSKGKANDSDNALVFISCGFDACEHEYESMSRHGRKVPVGFYHRFAQDARAFADKTANGRIISVLEGGYSDRALTSGSLAHITGLSGLPYTPQWWSEENLILLEKATKKRRGGRASLTPNSPPPPWLERTVEILATIGTSQPPVHPVAPPRSMALRDRNKGGSTAPPESTASAKLSNTTKRETKSKDKLASKATGKSEPSVQSSSADEQSPTEAPKRLPRVVLKLGPGPKEKPASTSE